MLDLRRRGRGKIAKLLMHLSQKCRVERVPGDIRMDTAVRR